MTDQHQPDLYILAGPNGAGKSTFARLFDRELFDRIQEEARRSG